MDSLPFRFFGFEGQAYQSTFLIVIALLVFILGFVVLHLSKKSEDKYEPLKDLSSSKTDPKNLYIPVQMTSTDYPEPKSSIYLRRLTLDRATLICSDEPVVNGRPLEFKLGENSEIKGHDKVIRGTITEKRRIGNAPESWMVNVKLSKSRP